MSAHLNLIGNNIVCHLIIIFIHEYINLIKCNAMRFKWYHGKITYHHECFVYNDTHTHTYTYNVIKVVVRVQYIHTNIKLRR